MATEPPSTLPLRVQGEIIGILFVSRDHPEDPYREEEQSFLQNIADRVAVAIRNSRLLQEECEHASELARELHDRVGQALTASESTLFRIAQEALTNVAKHSGATRVSIALLAEDGSALMVIADNSAAFDQSQVSASASRGLMTMRERAKAVGGRLRVTSSAGSGTRIEVQVPR
jgi:two-component system, NarL family, sensor kinase